MKNIFIVGSRGYHFNYGGWETFVSNLVDNYNDEDTLFYISEVTGDKKLPQKKNNNITVTPIYVKQKGSARMFLYSVKAFKYYINYIEKNNIQNAYIYVLGLKLFNYLKLYKRKLKKLNIKVFVNPDGLEHLRSKWSYPIKKFFLLSERLMLKNCDLVVCDGLGIKKYVDNKYHNLNTKYIAYGVNKIDLKDINESNILKEYNLKKDNYLLMVGRCVPENNYELVINEFKKSKIKKDLVIISNLSSSNYYDKLKEIANNKVHFINGVYDEKKLAIIRKNAYAYIHGHSVGGTNPSLIEALSLTDLNILYDVCFNHDIGLDTCLYFKEEGSLTKILNNSKHLDKIKKDMGRKAKKRINDNFTWDIIINQYKELFK